MKAEQEALCADAETSALDRAVNIGDSADHADGRVSGVYVLVKQRYDTGGGGRCANVLRVSFRYHLPTYGHHNGATALGTLRSRLVSAAGTQRRVPSGC